MLYVWFIIITGLLYFAFTNPKAKPIHLDIGVSLFLSMIAMRISSRSTEYYGTPLIAFWDNYYWIPWHHPESNYTMHFLFYAIIIFVLIQIINDLKILKVKCCICLVILYILINHHILRYQLCLFNVN